MKFYKPLILIFLLQAMQCPVALKAANEGLPGYLVVSGGGDEVSGGWSEQAYRWGIDKSLNKKVAVISFEVSSQTSMLKPYFLSLGALECELFVVRSFQEANSKKLYDKLMSYDFIYFADGDQWDYYSNYKSSLLHYAVVEKFNSGGVIGGNAGGMQILSEVIFTSQYGAAYSEECLSDPDNKYIRLADDFLNLLPGYILDSKITERNRSGRLTSFIQNWKTYKGNFIKGLGIDNNTTLCIDTTFTGYVFGYGAVSIYSAVSYPEPSSSDIIKSYYVTQVLRGSSVNLKTLKVSNHGEFIIPNVINEDFPGHLLLSGSDDASENLGMIEKLVSTGNSSDSVLIITGQELSDASFFINVFHALDFDKFEVLQTIPANENVSYWLARITTIPKILFVGDDYYSTMAFMYSGDVGPYLLDILYSGKKIVAFAGSSSRLAGGRVVVNYDEKGAAYNGLLETGPGLGLLKTMVIMPNSFSSDIIDVENAASGIPYTMVVDSVAYGVWLSGNTYLEYYSSNSISGITSYGEIPAIVLQNKGTWVDNGGNGNGNDKVNYRQIAGFTEMKLSYLDSNSVLQVGSIVEQISEANTSDIVIYPNPAVDHLNIEWPGNYPFSLVVANSDGLHLMERVVYNNLMISTQGLKSGLYYLYINKIGYDNLIVKKFIIS